jgi:hypothetical protein
MNLPIQARPVMRGHDRRGQDRGHGPPPDAMGRAVEQSALDWRCARYLAQPFSTERQIGLRRRKNPGDLVLTSPQLEGRVWITCPFLAIMEKPNEPSASSASGSARPRSCKSHASASDQSQRCAVTIVGSLRALRVRAATL